MTNVDRIRLRRQAALDRAWRLLEGRRGDLGRILDAGIRPGDAALLRYCVLAVVTELDLRRAGRDEA